jgi:hypothetical protein
MKTVRMLAIFTLAICASAATANAQSNWSLHSGFPSGTK